MIRPIDTVKSMSETDVMPTRTRAPQTSSPTSIGGREALLKAARAELVEHGNAAISLRAVARRAGVSHAAPKFHFGDRAGLLTAVATEGFQALAAALRQAVQHQGDHTPDGPESEPSDAQRLAALGRAYVDFGLADPALFDLMHRPSELHPGDPGLSRAQRESMEILASAVGRVASPVSTAGSSGPPTLALISWALVHGLVTLTRDGALQAASGMREPADVADLVRNLTEVFSARISEAPARRAAQALSTS
jgi:AcrR family transcriptional regulator